MHNYIIGMPKCGTTTIYSALLTDNRVSLGGEKEHNYFSHDVMSFKTASVNSDAEYCSKFDSEKVCIDVSVNYAMSKRAPKAIYQFNSSAKILLIYRSPYNYIKSQFRQLYFAGYEKHRSLLKSLNAEIDGKPNRYCPYNDLLEYRAIADRWREFFPSMTIVKYEDLFLRQDSTSCLIYDWLGLDALRWEASRHNSSEEKVMNKYSYPLKNISGGKLNSLVPATIKHKIKGCLEKRGRVYLDDDISFLPERYKASLEAAEEFFNDL